MTDGRERRKAKQMRRNQRKARKRRSDNASEAPLVEPPRPPADPVDPWSFLVYASMQVESARDDPMAKFRSHQHEPFDFDYLITKFVNAPTPADAGLVALFADLLDGEIQVRYRDAIAAYNAPLPRLTTTPRDVEVHRALRVSHVVGDTDQVLIGARLSGGQEATCAVLINHLSDSEITDAAVLVAPIDAVVDELSGPDVTVVNMSLADLRAWLEHRLRQNCIMWDTPTWPGCRPLLQWMVGRLPGGGYDYEPPVWRSDAIETLLDEFFATEDGAVFDRRDHRLLMRELIETGTSDPLRWSAKRVARILESPLSERDHPLRVLLEIPDLLRVFIPFAHARSGIGDELTAQTIAGLDWRNGIHRSA